VHAFGRVGMNGCLCAHGFERVIYRVDDDGRERCMTLPLR
jgi:hypothetical protein